MNRTFSQTVLSLLSGKMIDRITQPSMMNWLEEEDNLVSVQTYLQPLNRQVLMTSDKEGAYLGYININEKQSAQAIRQSFSNISIQLYPLVLWLRLVRGATDSSRPLQAGDKVQLSNLLASIESSKQLELQLADIIAKIGRHTKEAKKQLYSLVEYLEKEGYLHPIDTAGTQYKATAKWSLLYDQLAYIGKYQHIHHEDETNESNDLTHQNSLDMFDTDPVPAHDQRPSSYNHETSLTNLALTGHEEEIQHDTF